MCRAVTAPGMLSGAAARRLGELKRPRCGRLAEKSSEARAGCPKSRLGLPLRSSPPSVCTHPETFFPLWVRPLKSPSSGHRQVPCSFWPTRCAQRKAPGRRTISADLSLSSPRPPASGLPIQAASWGRLRLHLGGVTGLSPAGGLPRTGCSWREQGAGCAEEGAPGGAHGARRLQHHGQVAPLPRAAGLAARPPGVMPLSPAQSCSRRVRSAASRLASLHPASVLPGSSAQVQRKCCRHRGKPRARPLETTRPLLPPPAPWLPRTGSALPS